MNKLILVKVNITDIIDMILVSVTVTFDDVLFVNLEQI